MYDDQKKMGGAGAFCCLVTIHTYSFVHDGGAARRGEGGGEGVCLVENFFSPLPLADR